MENREIKFEELMDKFDSLLVKYREVRNRLREMESCGAPAEEQGELAGEEYILEVQLRKLGEKICDLTDSDEVKRGIARDFVDVEIEPGPCMARFVLEAWRNSGVNSEKLMRELMRQVRKLWDEYRLEELAKEIHVLWDRFAKKSDRECSIDYGKIEVRFRGKD